MKNAGKIGFVLAFLLPFAGCGNKTGSNVVLYCAQDEAHATSIIQLFEKETGIKVKTLFDRELTKTVGLVNQLVEEARRPRCDVFWNNEIINTVKLKEKGILAPYISESGKDLPDRWKDPEGFWTGFAARARIIIINTKKLPNPGSWPKSIFELGDPKWKGKCAVARPRTGTTLTHFAALYQVLGKTRAEKFFHKILENQVGLTQGNAHVKNQVANGKFYWGITDTDDFNVARLQGYPVKMVYPDQDGIGTMVIPNTVCMIKGGPNPGNARKLIDFLLSRRVESLLAKGKSAQIPLRPDVDRPAFIKEPSDNGEPGTFKAMKWDPVSLGGKIDVLAKRLAEIFSR